MMVRVYDERLKDLLVQQTDVIGIEIYQGKLICHFDGNPDADFIVNLCNLADYHAVEIG